MLRQIIVRLLWAIWEVRGCRPTCFFGSLAVRLDDADYPFWGDDVVIHMYGCPGDEKGTICDWF